MNTSLLTSVDNDAGPVLVPLTVQQYHAMIASGILQEGEPIELIDGLLVRKDRRDSGGSILTVGPRHTTIVTRLDQLFIELLSAVEFYPRIQQPITLNGLSEPEPDVAVVRGSVDSYTDHHPGPADIALVVEVADSSLKDDRDTKLRLYAAAGIPAYWIVNLRDNVVEVFERPLPGDKRYAVQNSCGPTGSLSFPAGDDRYAIDLAKVF